MYGCKPSQDVCDSVRHLAHHESKHNIVLIIDSVLRLRPKVRGAPVLSKLLWVPLVTTEVKTAMPKAQSVELFWSSDPFCPCLLDLPVSVLWDGILTLSGLWLALPCL